MSKPAPFNPTDYPGFDPLEFDIEQDVALFDEHQDYEPARDENGIIQRDADGKPIKFEVVHYTRDKLESMCEVMNRRIRDGGDFCPITVGHSKAEGADTPPVVGFAGPFYVGTFGKEKPRAMIFAKNFALYREKAGELKKAYPRRSVELWAEPEIENRYFDPISLLGAETPRRDLGLRYSRKRAGSTVPVICYSAVAPGGCNTFVPGDDRKERYQKDQEDDGSMITDEDVQKIVMAVMQTAEMGYVRSQMLADESKGSQTPEAPEEGPAADGAPGEELEPEAGDGNPFDEREGEPETFSESDDDDAGEFDDESPDDGGGDPEEDEDMATPAPPKKDKELFSRREAAHKISYAKLEAAQAATAAENKSLKERLDRLEREAGLKERYSKLEDLARAGYPIDVEVERTHADNDSPADWARRMEVIETYAKPAIVDAPMLRPIPSPQRQSADKLDRRAELIRERIETYGKRRDTSKSFREIAAEVDAELAAGK